MARRTHKRGPRLALPWEREDSPYRSLLTGRRVWPFLGAVAIAGLLFGAHWLGGRRADVRSTRAILGEVEDAARAFVGDIGRCPHNAAELVHPPRSGVHYLSEPPLDAWGRAVHLRCISRGPNRGPDIEATSAGVSGSFLDDDNIL